MNCGCGWPPYFPVYPYLPAPPMMLASITAPPSLAIFPTGNNPPTLSSFSVQAPSVASGQRQFLGHFGLTSNSDHGVIGADHVALYAGVVGSAGSSDIWAVNTLTEMASTFPADCNAQGIELDFNNNARNTGSAAGPAAIAVPVAYGLAISGASVYTSTAGLVVSGATTTQWYRGIMVTGSSVYSAFSDYSSANVGIEMVAHHNIGIDMGGSIMPTAILTGNNQAITSRDAGGTGEVQIAIVNGADALVLGFGSTGVEVTANFAPNADNAWSCGTPTSRWSAVWANNGTVQTSDVRLKTDIRPLPSAIGLVRSIEPRTFKWKDGGGGVPGKRTHWGFLAADVKAGFDAIGADFGGYVKSEDGTEHLRPDQMIPVLWKAVQELSERISA